MPWQGRDDISSLAWSAASPAPAPTATSLKHCVPIALAAILLSPAPERERTREMFATHAKNRSALKSLRVRVQQQARGIQGAEKGRPKASQGQPGSVIK